MQKLCALTSLLVLLASAVVAESKSELADSIATRADSYWQAARQIWEWAEPGYREEKSSALLSDLLAKVTTPTLVLHCRGDAGVPFDEGRRLAAMIPNARFVALEGDNHLILEHEPAWPRFLSELRSFLAT